jgi:hypothetical protein
MLRAFKFLGACCALFLISGSLYAQDRYYKENHWSVSHLSSSWLEACEYYISGNPGLSNPRVTNIWDGGGGNWFADCEADGGPYPKVADLKSSLCDVSTPYLNNFTCSATPVDHCTGQPVGGFTYVKVGTFDRTTGTYTQDADFNGPGTYADIGGCSYQVGDRSPGKECGVEVGNNNLVCRYQVSNTYTNYTGPGGPTMSDIDANVETNETIQDWLNKTTTINTTPVLNDTPGPGETQQSTTEITTLEYPPEFHQDTVSDTTTITMKEGYDIVQTTTTTITTHVDNSTTEVVNQNFDQSSQTTTTTVINNTPTAPGITSSTAPGYSGGTTTTTITDASGNISSSTVSSGTSPSGIPDTPNEEQDEGEYTGPADLDTTDTDQALADLDSVASGIGTDAASLENHSLFNLNPLDNLGGACQSISFSMPNGETMVVPGTDGCSKLSTLKSILEWVVYVMLVFYAYNLATRRTA